MFNISSFLEKLSKNLSSQEEELQKVCDIVLNTAGIKIEQKSISIKNNILFLEISPALKNKVFINKQKILENLSSLNTKIIDIR